MLPVYAGVLRGRGRITVHGMFRGRLSIRARLRKLHQLHCGVLLCDLGALSRHGFVRCWQVFAHWGKRLVRPRC